MARAEQLPSSEPSLLDHQIGLVMTPPFAEAAGGEAALARATGTLVGKMLRGDGIEEMLVAQMLALHNAVMDDLAQAKAQHDLETIFACRNSANKSSRTCALLAEKLMTLRGKSTEQKVTVEHVHVHAGGQAIVGNVSSGRGGGGKSKTEEQSHACEKEAVRGQDEIRRSLPELGTAERTVPDAWRESRRTTRQPQCAEARQVHHRGDYSKT